MTTEEKNNELLAISKTLKYEKRFIFSDEGNLNSVNDIIETEQQKIGRKKPFEALWYSFGDAWIWYLTNNYTACTFPWERKRLGAITHLYEIEVNYEKVLKIETYKELMRFGKKYEKGGMINWHKVSKNYSGVEIEYQEKEPDWYEGWDCSSGCVWKKDGIKSIRLIGSWERNWGKFGEREIDEQRRVDNGVQIA